MDIKNLNPNMNSGRSSEALKPQDKPETTVKSETSAGQSATDKVTLTSMMTQVQELERKAESIDLDNQSRVEELKAAIQDGSYKVDAQKVAEKLIQTEALFANI